MSAILQLMHPQTGKPLSEERLARAREGQRRRSGWDAEYCPRCGAGTHTYDDGQWPSGDCHAYCAEDCGWSV